MEEKYFKKDNTNKQVPKDKNFGPPNQLQKVNYKMISTATTSGFRDTKNQQCFGGAPQATQIDFKKSCAFSSTLRNFGYIDTHENDRNNDDENDQVEESIHEEICQS